MQFTSSHPGYEHLRKKWIHKHQQSASRFWQKHGDLARHVAMGAVAGATLLTVPTAPIQQAHAEQSYLNDSVTKVADKKPDLATSLKPLLPQDVQKLTPDQEDQISQVLSQQLHMEVKPEIDGIRLNRSYGLIGGEQHLYRYPGDNIYRHADNATEWAMYGDAGIAPGLGAWGYFAPSESQLTKKDIEREKYYLAVQTFLAPGFAENVAKYRDFFKYRKMVVVNPQTGQAVVADIADAGPAEFTGKSLGGSPEVMEGLGLAGGPRKGAVLYFFVDDPQDKIPLGPINLTEQVH